MRPAPLLFAVVMLVAGRAHAAPDDALLDRVAATVKGGAPLVIQAHLALCDNSVIRCGGHGLGDGDSLRTNLYWATTEGLAGWLREAPGAWARVADEEGGRPERLRVAIWKRTVAPSARLGARGVTRPFEAWLVVDVWRGRDIDAGVATFVDDLQGSAARTHEVAGRTLAAGGAAPLVAWVGHNRWMDDEEGGWRAAPARSGPPKGVFAVACYTRPYLKPRLVRDGHVPLLLTNDFVMASGAALVGALDAFLDGGDLRTVRTAATREYARAGKKDAARLSRVFTNPSVATF